MPLSPVWITLDLNKITMLGKLSGSANNAMQDVYVPESGIKISEIPTVVRVNDDVSGNPVFTIAPVDADPETVPPSATTVESQGTSLIIDRTYLGPPIMVPKPGVENNIIAPLAVKEASFPKWLIWLGLGIGAYLIFKPKNHKE